MKGPYHYDPWDDDPFFYDFLDVEEENSHPSQENGRDDVLAPTTLDMADPDARVAYLLDEIEAEVEPPPHEQDKCVPMRLVPPSVLQEWERRRQQLSQGKDASLELITSRINELIAHRGMVNFVPLDETASILLRDIARLMPNMRDVLERVQRSLVYYQRAYGFAYFRPLLLVGPPGTGKTLFAEMLVRALRVPVVRVDCGNIDSSFQLVGMDRGWSNSHPGDLAMALLEHRIGNIVVILDELEKLFLRSNHNAPPSTTLYKLLEPQLMKNYEDLYLKLPMRAHRIMFIATANDTRMLPPAIRNRLRICPVSPVRERDIVRILGFIYRFRAKQVPLPWASRISKNALEMLVQRASGSVRKALLLLEDAMALAASQQTKRLCVTKKMVQQVLEEDAGGPEADKACWRQVM